MEQEPYEFWICPAKPESKGKASAAFVAARKDDRNIPNTRLPCFTEKSFERGRLLRMARGPFGAAGLRQRLQRQEMTWAIKKT
jgi:hypothetical protein